MQGLVSKHFTPGLQLSRELNYTKCLVALLPDVVPNCQNRALKKKKKKQSWIQILDTALMSEKYEIKTKMLQDH